MKSIPNFNIEARINSAFPIQNVEEILIPLSSVYEHNFFCGLYYATSNRKRIV